VIGLVGVGRMGAPIIAAFADAGYRPLAYDSDAARRDIVLAAGATWSPTSDQVLREANVLVTVLPGPRETAEFLTDAALATMRTDALWLDLASGDPFVTGSIVERAASRGIASVSAPMGGSVEDARRRSLTFFVGGDQLRLARVEPLLRILAAPDGIRVVSEHPQDAQSVKLIANAVWSANVLAGTEALLLGRALGLDPETMLSALSGSAAQSVAVSKHLPRLLDGDYLETFGIDRLVDEFDAVGRLAAQMGVEATILGEAARLHRLALETYGPTLGELLGARLLEDRSGAALRRSTDKKDESRHATEN
jgi:3-hydroxyisobutyrate dehydrogenase-like beta-hydroxyacid dehydrogenase